MARTLGSKNREPRKRKWRWFEIEKRVFVRLYNPTEADIKSIYKLAQEINIKNNGD